MRKTKISPIILAVAMCCLAGCSPYVRMDEPRGWSPFHGNNSNDDTIISDANSPSLTLIQALKYADLAKKKYLDKLDNQAEISSAAALGLIPLTAAGIGLGVTGGSSTAITALALTGATGLALNTWYVSKPEQRVYLAGYIATGCAIDAVTPLQYMADKTNALATDLQALDDARSTVAGELLLLNSYLQANDPAALADPRQVAAIAQAQLDAADEASKSGWSLFAAVRMAGPNLKQAVDRIAGEVNASLVEVAPDTQTLTSIISQLAQGYGQLKTALTPPAAPAKPQSLAAQSDNPAVDLAAQLREDLPTLKTAILKVQSYINSVGEPTQLATTLKSCGVELPLGINPAGTIQLAEKEIATVGRTITGGRAPFTVSLVDDASGLQVKQPTPFGPAFTIHNDGTAKVAKYVVQVTDAAGNQLPVTVEVVGAAAGGGKTGSTDQGSGQGGVAEFIAAFPSADKTLNGADGNYNYVFSNPAKVDEQTVSVKWSASKIKPTDTNVPDPSTVKSDVIKAALKAIPEIKKANIDWSKVKITFQPPPAP